MRVGLFGGSFNPIHYGHLRLAETARESLRLDRVLFIPAGQPPHKGAAGLLEGRERLKLVEMTIRDHPAFIASDIELERPGVSYTVETVGALKRRLPDAKLFLLVGEDMLTIAWRGWKELKALCTVAVARRARPAARGASSAARIVPPRSAAAARRQPGLMWLDMPPLDISSSDIRRRLAQGRSIRYLVPPAVERYIRDRRLYQKAGRAVG